MTSKITLLNEPALEFGYCKTMTDPRVGLSLFGPYDRTLASHPRSIPYAIVGTANGIALFKSFVTALRHPVVSCSYGQPGVEDKDVRLWPPFPGFF